MTYIHSLKHVVLAAILLSTAACSTATMETDQQTKVGFSNITDTPLPVSATMDMEKSMVTGSGDTWSGHLVYKTKKPQTEVIEFINREMLATGWSKVSELRGHETVLMFIKGKRVATTRVTTEKGLISNSTLVAIDMANSNMRHTLSQDNQDDA